MIINPGSENKGGSLAQANLYARQWLKSIHDEGFKEVEMQYVGQSDDGDYVFNFTHGITKKTAVLETHGFSEKQIDNFIFSPRQYWNGSSTANPKIEDWLEDGWSYRIEYYKK